MVMGYKAKQTFKALHKGKGDFVSPLFFTEACCVENHYFLSEV